MKHLCEFAWFLVNIVRDLFTGSRHPDWPGKC